MAASSPAAPVWLLRPPAFVFGLVSRERLLRPCRLEGGGPIDDVAQGTEGSDFSAIAGAAPDATMTLIQPERMVGVTGTGRPRRVHERVVQVLLDVLGGFHGVA